VRQNSGGASRQLSVANHDLPAIELQPSNQLYVDDVNEPRRSVRLLAQRLSIDDITQTVRLRSFYLNTV
jgi:hypothetical protein